MQTCPVHEEPKVQKLKTGRPNGWECRSCAREYHRRWAVAHPRPPRVTEASARQDALAARGCACERCGFADVRALQFDHTNGDGATERRSSSKRVMYRAIARGERPDMVLLCANCHAIVTFDRRAATL